MTQTKTPPEKSAQFNVLFHDPSRQVLQDVVTAIRHNVTIDELGHRRERFADRYLKPPAKMLRLFARYPEALDRMIEIAGRCTFRLDDLAYQYPDEKLHPELTPQQALEKLTWEGAAARYPEGLPDKVRGNLKQGLWLIAKLDYAPYFLTVNAIVRFARSKDILCQVRGSLQSLLRPAFESYASEKQPNDGIGVAIKFGQAAATSASAPCRATPRALGPNERLPLARNRVHEGALDMAEEQCSRRR